jgi:hypothetical protein
MHAGSNRSSLAIQSLTTQNDADLEWLLCLAATFQTCQQQSAKCAYIPSKPSIEPLRAPYTVRLSGPTPDNCADRSLGSRSLERADDSDVLCSAGSQD